MSSLLQSIANTVYNIPFYSNWTCYSHTTLNTNIPADPSNVNPITPRFITLYSSSLTHLYQTQLFTGTLFETIKPSHNSLFHSSSADEKRLYLVSAKALGRPPSPMTDIPLQISTPLKEKNHAITHIVSPVLNSSYNFIHISTTHQPFPLLTDTFTFKSTSLIHYCIINFVQK